MLETKFIKVKSKKYGNVIAFYNPCKDKLYNGYTIRAFKHGKRLMGYIDIYGKLVIDLEHMALVNCLSSNDNKDICLTYEAFNYESKTYHLKNKDLKCKLVKSPNLEYSVGAFYIPHVNNYWLLTFEDQDHPRYAIYNYRTCKLMTAIFDKFEYVTENEIHKFYFEKDLYGTCEDKELYVTTLCGYLNKNCMLSSNILDTELGSNIYPAYLYKTTISQKFEDLCTNIIASRTIEYFNKKANNDSIIDHMCYHPVIYGNEQEAKIYQFKRKND